MRFYPFPHDGPVYAIVSEELEAVYYDHDGLKFKRVRVINTQTWDETFEIPCDDDVFWMIVACIERKKRHAT